MNQKVDRRSALKSAAAAGAVLILPTPVIASSVRPAKKIKLGIIADLHGGLATDAEARLDEFLDVMQQQRCDALIQLGDFAFPNEKHQRFADKFNAAHESTLHVIGNHEFDFGLTRKDCYRAWGIESNYYRRDINGVRILVLDGNEKGSPSYRGGYPSYIGQEQFRWLEKELEDASLPVMVLSHQPLAGIAAIDNAKSIQILLAKYKSKVLLCLNGHTHIDSLVQIEGVPFLHLNSASYYWVGGDHRMAYYNDPLYSVVTIDPESDSVIVEGKSSSWRNVSPEQIGYFEVDREATKKEITPRIRDHHVSKTSLSVMSWNIWGRLNQEPRYTIKEKTARERVVDIIRESNVDVVGMIETYGSAADIAENLGFHFHTPEEDANLCIFSRYPLSEVEPLEKLNSFSFIAATITLPAGQKVRFYNIWLTSGGRHIVEIKNKKVSNEAFASGDDKRYVHLRELLDHPDFKTRLAAVDRVPIIVAGDFNCVSHLDYTNETKGLGLNQSRVLEIKVSRAMADVGFVDSYRFANPNFTAETLGHTWTTVGKEYVYESEKGFVPVEEGTNPKPEYRDPYARIDYIYSAGANFRAVESKVIRNHSSNKKRSFPEFPSDHAAVVTQFRFTGQ